MRAGALRPHLAEVVPPRRLERAPLRQAALLAALPAGERLQLTSVLAAGGPRFLVRARSEGSLSRALSALGAAYPQSALERIDLGERPDLDPALVGATEESVRWELAPRSDPALPLREQERAGEPLLQQVLGAPALLAGERVLLELSVERAPPGEAERLGRRAPARAARGDGPAAPGAGDAARLVIPLALGAAGLRAYLWWEQGELLALALFGAAALCGTAALALGAGRILRRRAPLEPALLRRKLSGPLLRASLRVSAIGPRANGPSGAGTGRLRALASEVAASLGCFDDPSGGGLRAARRGRLLLSAGEAASLWHLPEVGALPLSRRAGAPRLPVAPGHADRGARLGVRTAAPAGAASGGEVRMPPPLLERNQLVVAKTRRGKSTLLSHLARGVMERAIADPKAASLVVVDPHQDLAEAVLDSVPHELSGRAVYLDMAHRERPVGLNLLDVGLFPDRDLATEHVVTVMSRIWPESWGPRMEGALRASVATLMELNRGLSRERQHTLLDVAPLLANADYRWSLLDQLDDPVLHAWWRDNYSRLHRALQQQVATPVTNKIGRFVVTEASRLLLGQARSTVDPRLALRERSVLVINTAAGALGEGASALVGATWLNLLGLMVEEQVRLPASERRRVVVLVDESSTLAAVDYRRMLSELVKYGASFVLVAQGLARLDTVDPQLVPTIASNIDGLTVFQVSAQDAGRLAPELGAPLEAEDLTALDDFECYARWWDGRARPPAFSFRVDPPPRARGESRARVAERSAALFGRPRAKVAAEVARALEAPDRAGRPAAARARRTLPREGALHGAGDEAPDLAAAAGEPGP